MLVLWGCLFLFCLFILICYFHYTRWFVIKMGEPPIGCMLVAYKYSYKDRNPVSTFRELHESFPSHSLIKFCYCGSKPKHVEYANGVILQEDAMTLDAFLLEKAYKKGFSIIMTPAISHSVFTQTPAFYILPMTYLLGVMFSYPRIFSFIEKHHLCGYPVMEVYRRKSLDIVVPLVQQDDFVVKEAFRAVHDFKLSAMLLPVINGFSVKSRPENGHKHSLVYGQKHHFETSPKCSLQNGHKRPMENGHTRHSKIGIKNEKNRGI